MRRPLRRMPSGVLNGTPDGRGVDESSGNACECVRFRGEGELVLVSVFSSVFRCA